MLGHFDYTGVPGIEDWTLEPHEMGARTLLLNAVPALHFGAVLDLAWEDFVEVDGAILRKRFVENGGIEKWRDHVNSRRELEAIGNMLHVWDLAKHDERDVPQSYLQRIAEVLAEIIEAKVTRQFPGRDFLVLVTTEADDHGPSIYVEQDDHGEPVPFPRTPAE